MIVSAYDINDKLVEGKLRTSPLGNKFVLNEDGFTKLEDLKYARFIEEEKNDVDKKVTDDVSHLKPEVLKNTKEEELQKAGEEREKELKNAGMKIDDQEYSTKFVIQAANKASEAENGVDPNAADFKNSKALSQFGEQEETDLHPDYQDVVPYEDTQTRDQIYMDLNNEITDYKNGTTKFQIDDFQEHLCIKYLNGERVDNESLKDTFKRILDN